MSTKLITIVGITGNQGASVANAFINEPGWKIRGISRDPSKASSKVWSDKGVEMVAADLDDPASLVSAFKGSNAIFGVTDFWQQVKIPANYEKAKAQGKTINVIASEAEIAQGKAIVDAAQATIDTLDMLVLSVIGDATKWSHGRITWNYHFDSKWRFAEYARDMYPELWKKTSLFQPGYFSTNLASSPLPQKQPDGSYVMSLPLDGDKPVPMFNALEDSGKIVKALFENKPGLNIQGYSTLITFNEIAQIWGQNLGHTVHYKRGTVDDLDKAMPGGVGRELGEMMEYISDPGYFGGEEAVKELNLITPSDLGVSGLSDVRKYVRGLTMPEAK